jgi:ectoine hydroxylase-related dioxygenase (phytanoyl-CoA dioxygenase family)
MVVIQPDSTERANGRLSPENIARGKAALEQDGFVVLEDVVDLEHLRMLKERMLADLPKILNRPDAPFNFTKSNVQQDPPPFEPYLFKDVLMNEFVTDLTETVMGKGVFNAFYSGNTAIANTTQWQPTHADMGHLWPNMPVATPPYALVVNIPVVDMDASNGSTELWPGTHLDTSVALSEGDIRLPPDVLEARRREVPPLQPAVRAGSVLIRDIRMWHGGTPNPSDQARPMIALIHWVGWWPISGGPVFPTSAKGFFENSRLRTHAEFVDGPIEYLGHNVAYDVPESEAC